MAWPLCWPPAEPLGALGEKSLGENWNQVMHDCMAESSVAWLYFVSFMIVACFLLLNVVIGVVLEEFTASQSMMRVTPAAISNFNKQWMELDPEATHAIHFSKIEPLVRRLSPPFGVKGANHTDRRFLAKRLCSLQIPQAQDGQVHYIDVVTSMIRAVLEEQSKGLPAQSNNGTAATRASKIGMLHRELVEKIYQSYPELDDFSNRYDNRRLTFNVQYAVMKIQSSVRMQLAWRKVARLAWEARAAVTIQRFWRRRVLRRAFMTVVTDASAIASNLACHKRRTKVGKIMGLVHDDDTVKVSSARRLRERVRTGTWGRLAVSDILTSSSRGGHRADHEDHPRNWTLQTAALAFRTRGRNRSKARRRASSETAAGAESGSEGSDVEALHPPRSPPVVRFTSDGAAAALHAADPPPTRSIADALAAMQQPRDRHHHHHRHYHHHHQPTDRTDALLGAPAQEQDLEDLL